MSFMRHRIMLNCLGVFYACLLKNSALVCVFTHGICPLSANAGRQRPLDHPGRLDATTVSAILPPYNEQSSCSVNPTVEAEV